MLFTKLRRDIFRHKGLFLAVSLIVLLGIAIYGATYDSYQNLNNSYAETHKILKFADHNFIGGPFLEEDEASVENTVGVESAEARLVTELPVETPAGSKIIGRFIGLPENGDPKVNKLRIEKGENISDGNINQIVVEKHFFEDHELKIGDNLSILGVAGAETYTIVGEAVSAEYIWPAKNRQSVLTSTENFGVFFVDQENLQTLLGNPVFNEIVVRFEDGVNQESVSEEIVANLGESRVTDSFDKEKQASNEALSQDLDGFRELSFLFPILFLAVASMSIYISLSRLIHAQRPQIGVLRANGYSSSDILVHYLSFGIVIAIVGSIPGVILGVLLSSWITTFYTSLLSIPIVKISFYPSTILVAVAMAFFFTLIAAFFPARAAVSVTPAAAMRGETPMGGGRSLFELIFPFLKKLSPVGKLPLRNISRNKRRSLSTILGVVFAFILIMVSWGMLDTINKIIDTQFEVIHKNDYFVAFSQPVQKERISEIESISGVRDIEPVFVTPVTLSFSGKKYATSLSAFDENTKMHTFINKENKEMKLPSSGVYAGQALRRELGVKKGDLVEITIPQSNVTIEERVVDFVNEPIGTLVYGNYVDITEKAGVDKLGISSVYLTSDTENRRALRNRLNDLEYVAVVEDTKSLLETIENFLVLFYGIVGVMLTFGAIMAAALLFNTMAVNITERTREIATMLTVGYSNGRVVLLTFIENILLVTMALIPGLVAGFYVSRYFMEQWNSDIFSLNFHFKASSYLIIIALVYSIGFVSQIPSLLRIGGFKLSEIIRERIS